MDDSPAGLCDGYDGRNGGGAIGRLRQGYVGGECQ